MEDSDIEDLLQQAGRPGASNSAAMEHVQQVVSDADATGLSGSAQTEECMQEGAQMSTEPAAVQACPEGITEELDAKGREIALHFQPAKRRCFDDLKLDKQRFAASKRPLDDLQLDKKRLKVASGESDVLDMNASESAAVQCNIACTMLGAQSRATDAPT